MKKLFALFLCAIMALSVACATAETAPEETGKLVLYSPLTTSMIENMLAMFEADTGIKTECLAMGTGDALKRIAAESENPQCDILWSGTIGTVKNSSHYFQDYTCANEDAFYEQYRNVEGNLTRFDCVPSVIMINTDLIGDIEINGYADLLNPELKGKIVFADPQASSSSFEHLVNMLYAMGTDGQPNGWDYVREFCKQLPNGCVNSSSAVYKGVADGEYAVGLTFEQGAATFIGHSNLFHATLSKKDGRTELCFPSGYRLPMTTLSDECADGQKVVVGIRPEEFSVSSEGLTCDVLNRTFLGRYSNYFLHFADGMCVPDQPSIEFSQDLGHTQTLYQPGDHLTLRPNPDKINVFTADMEKSLLKDVIRYEQA